MDSESILAGIPLTARPEPGACEHSAPKIEHTDDGWQVHCRLCGLVGEARPTGYGARGAFERAAKRQRQLRERAMRARHGG